MTTRRRAYSDDASAYSDDFISDEDDRRTRTPFKASRNGDRSRERDQTKTRGGNPMRGRGRGRGRSRGGRGNSRASEPINVKRSYDNVTKRVMSASRLKINELRNQVEELRLTVKELDQENKLYKKMQFRQDKALRGFEEKENDLPKILDKHNNEVRCLKDQVRKLKEKYDKSDRYLRDAEDELEKVKRRMNKYKEICDHKELAERDELSRKLTKAEIDMEEKDVKIKELERHMDVLNKNHRHELGIEFARQKELKRQLDEMNNKQNKVEGQLREKEKALEYNNIYSNRIGMTESNSELSSIRKLKKRAPSLTDLTPRDKAKFYEEKRRQEVRKQKETKAETEKKKRDKFEIAERLKAQEQEMKSLSPSPRAGIEFNFKSIDFDLEERELKARKKEEEERQFRDAKEKRELEEILLKKKELERRKQHEETHQKQKFETERENNAQREREERERKERERREREEKETKERERKEQQEQERREKERVEQDKRLQLERDKLEKDPSLQEERRKKDELLRKLQDMDTIGNNKPLPPDPFMIGGRSKENSSGYDTPGKRSDPKEYSFTKPVNNLHQGKPSHKDVSALHMQRQRGRPSKGDDDIGGYQPSFGPVRVGGEKTSSTKPLSLFDDDPAPMINTKKTDKKPSNLLENLFGSQANTNSSSNKAFERKNSDNDTFFITSNSSQANQKNTTNSTSSFPWETSASPSKNRNSQSTFSNDTKMGGSTLFGGGAAFVEDDLPSNSNRALPYRGRQQNTNTFSSKPSVTAIDHFDDDIEEVVL